ncbi:MAG: glutamate-ammonia-ligase adenylyltransferase [Alkalispirochaetaceae bacterium]
MRRSLLEGLPEELRGSAAPIVAELPDSMREQFEEKEILLHLANLARLGRERPVIVEVSASGNSCTVDLYSFDAPGLFSFITGALGAAGVNLTRGHVYTTTASPSLIFDSFAGEMERPEDPDAWATETEAFIYRLLEPLTREERSLRANSDTLEQCRRNVAEAVADAASRRTPGEQVLMPVDITFGALDTGFTRLEVEGQDTPFFLYGLSSALSLHQIAIYHVEIDTVDSLIRDVFEVRNYAGNPLTPEEEDRVRLAVLLTKQFTHVIDRAPDPLAALRRFEQLIEEFAAAGDGEAIQTMLADSGRQRELARLLGASDFLWEDFIRLQQENLLPLLSQVEEHRLLSSESEEVPRKLTQAIAEASSYEEKKRALNAFKDRQAFLIDIDHILQRERNFFFLSHRLTRLAEAVVQSAVDIAWDALTDRYGAPLSAAGMTAEWAAFGLGKLGGSALGYASDIELLFLYSDHGDTSGPEVVPNREFFERLFKEATNIIESRREGIFRVDVRLRPYGSDGPLAVPEESFVSYYGKGGPAHSAERLALVRLRAIAGSRSLGERVMRIRDSLIYETDSIDVSEIRSLRQRQLEEKLWGPRLNAKFSPGGLVDLEYNVQLLQVFHGRRHPQLRNPGIHATLRGLSEVGTIDEEEAEGMIRAYRFLRNLINGLRMLRGNAQDLFLPAYGTLEFRHLARRMGYEEVGEVAPEERLRLDFETETARVRSFVERHLGREAIPAGAAGNPADIVLSESLAEETSVLTNAGFEDPERGVMNLKRIAGEGEVRELFAALVVLAWEHLLKTSDPDMALNNWERFTHEVDDREAFFRRLLSQPRRLELMLKVFSGSQFLADTLIQNPGFLSWITEPKVVLQRRDQRVMESELLAGDSAESRSDWLNRLRRFRKREILRIGTKDICLGQDFLEVVTEISALGRAIISCAFDRIVSELSPQEQRVAKRCSLLAFGKLGGRELNYSSDIDLLLAYEPAGQTRSEMESRTGAKILQRLLRDLSDFTEEGKAYRVDLRLRPYGDSGELVNSVDQLVEYYDSKAGLWELQAMIKLSPVAGNIELGWELLERCKPILIRRISEAGGRSAVVRSIRGMREKAVDQYMSAAPDVKNGVGGIRDIEFVAQALQMVHARHYPEVLTGNTLMALAKLEEGGVLAADTTATLKREYVFLRRIEHFLQVYEDRQLHTIPADPRARRKLARLVLPEGEDLDNFSQRLSEVLQRVRGIYNAELAE